MLLVGERVRPAVHTGRTVRHRRRLPWRGRNREQILSLFVAIVGIVAFGAILVIAISSSVSWPVDFDGDCNSNAFACNTGLELFGTIVLGVVALVSFMWTRYRQVNRRYLQKVRKDASAFVPTATQIDGVVGRDGICEIIEDDLTDKDPRPQVVVGGMGTGKTALLVRLTERLADDDTIAVPVRLRDAREELSFLRLAKNRFIAHVRDWVTAPEADRIWEKLCRNRRIVILADGLEEALLDTPGRTAAIHRAFEQAQEDKVPLVVTSRPDDVLAGLDAAFIRLEPLAACDAVDYILGEERADNGAADDSVAEVAEVTEVAEIAEVAEAPFYLRVTRDLHRQGGLAGVRTDLGRLGLRVELLDRWTQCLLDGDLTPGVQLDDDERRDAIAGLESMAVVSLQENTLEVGFDQYRQSPYHRDVLEEPRDPRFVGRAGERLNLVELVRDGVRFRHSIMQAYLGARILPDHLYRVDRRGLGAKLKKRVEALSLGHPKAAGGPGVRFFDRALDRSGTEFLISLVMCCERGDDRLRRRVLHRLVDESKKAERLHKPVVFDVLAAAYQVDIMVNGRGRGGRTLGEATKKNWNGAGVAPPANGAQHEFRLVEAKMRALWSMALAGSREAYEALWDVCLNEPRYRVRLRAALAVGGGGEAAAGALLPRIVEGSASRQRLARNVRASQPDVRMGSVQGWILPLLAATTDPEEESSAKTRSVLKDWVKSAEGGLHLGVEGCLAQGLKFEANRLSTRRDATPPETRDFLVGLAVELLERSSWWYSQVSLLQALTLWSLDPRLNQEHDLRGRIEGKANSKDDARKNHPFVSEAAILCLDALDAAGGTAIEKFAWSSYVWMDEAAIVTRVGTTQALPDTHLWVPIAVGWLSLQPRARQLVADILMLLNLMEGPASANTEWREEQRTGVLEIGTELPHCLAHARRRGAIHGGRKDSKGAETQGCGCGLGLCPLQQKPASPFRGELSETFCREQKRQLRGSKADVPPWVAYGGWALLSKRRTRKALEEFWGQMEKRDESRAESER
jgi:hypothetical protein